MKSDEERFWDRLSITDGCWLWTGAVHRNGYGVFYLRAGRVSAHRFAYELAKGPIPDGLVIDHLCRVRHCVNPTHLEPVTSGENVLRGVGFGAQNAKKTHCPYGHPYSSDNTYVKPNGHRGCRVCAARTARATEKRRGALLKAAAARLGITTKAYTDLHGKSMRKALQIAGETQEKERARA